MRKFNTRLFASLLAVFCCMTALSATAYADGGYYEQSEDGSETPPSSIDSITISTESRPKLHRSSSGSRGQPSDPTAREASADPHRRRFCEVPAPLMPERLSPLRKGRACPKTAAPLHATCFTTSTPTSSSSRWKPATAIPSIIVIDYAKPLDDDGKRCETYFLNLVDES